MATAVVEPQAKSLKDPALKQHLQRLRRVNNARAAFDVARTWLFLGLVIAAAVAFDIWRAQAGLHWTWDVPVFATAIVLIGAGQHQLTALGHEASHHVLFSNRLVNELVSDWLCMFPVFSTTHHYRLHHIAHHQFVNDPELDPNFAQLQVNGHWVDFPMTPGRLLTEFLKQFLPWNVLNYLRATAMTNAMATDHSPYLIKSGAVARLAKVIGVVYLFGLMGLVVWLVIKGNAALFYGVTLGIWAAAMAFFLVVPSGWFVRARIHSTVSIRWLSLMRLTWITMFFVSAGGLAIAFGPKVLAYFGSLWILPLLSSFSFFMMMRQMVQHSNLDRGWLSNTRIYLMNRFVRASVLPFGQDYHLPHHLYATVPHYNLKELHEVLMEYPEYREQAMVVENVVIPRYEHDYHHPTLVEVLGPEYAPEVRHAVHVDNSVLEDVRVDEKEEILKAARASQAKE